MHPDVIPGSEHLPEVAVEACHSTDALLGTNETVPIVRLSTVGSGRKGARSSEQAMAPQPGPPPPWGVEKVLCKLKCMMSTSASAGRIRPMFAFMFAPSMYRKAPDSCNTSAISFMFRS